MNGHQHQLPLRPMSDTFTVVCEINGTSHSFSCSAEQTVLAAAEAAGVPEQFRQPAFTEADVLGFIRDVVAHELLAQLA